MLSDLMEFEKLKHEIEEKERTRPADDIKKKIPIPDHVPVGNKLAHFIRSIHWNSKGMFPSTAGSQRTYDKYHTVTQLSFSGPNGFNIEPGEVDGGFQRKRETVGDVISKTNDQNFCRWSVPDRLLDDRVVPVHDTIHEELEAPSVKPEAPIKKMTPPPPSRVSRQMSLPDIPLRQPPSPRIESRNGLQQTAVRTPRSAEVMTPTKLALPERSKTMYVDRRSPMVPEARAQSRNGAFGKNGLPLSALRPEAVPQAEAWMKNADLADKKVIERILKIASKKNALENSLKKTLLPDAKESVEQWLKDANENERQVALDFFNSLSGSQLMGMTVANQRKRLKDVINSLEGGTPTGKPAYPARPQHFRSKTSLNDGKLRYIRLLTPDARENRWMHTTWHHLPEYKDPKVTNWSSHYIRPHAQIPRHFVIHPDWG